MPKVHDDWKNINLSDFDAHDHALIAELIDNTLREKGIDAAAVGYDINVNYLEIEDE